MVLALAGLMSAFPATSRRVVQSLMVSATVAPSAAVAFEVVSQPFSITKRDIERGYVEVVMKSRVRMRGVGGIDTPPQMVLAMEPRSDLFRSVSLAAQSGNAVEGRVAEFRYRFQLAQAAKLGEFGTAISVSVDL